MHPEGDMTAKPRRNVSDKDDAIALIQRLPDHISLETIISELMFRVRVLRGLEQADRGEVVNHEEVVEEMARWRPSAGQ
jgi:predicted transcriptional regulator